MPTMADRIAGKLLGQRGVDQAMPLEPALAGEGGRDDLDAEMRFAALAPAGMAMMLMGLVDHPKMLGRELRAELAGDPVGHGRHVGSLVLLARGPGQSHSP